MPADTPLTPEARADAIAKVIRLPHGSQCRQMAEAGWLCSCDIQQRLDALRSLILAALRATEQATWEAAAAIAEGEHCGVTDCLDCLPVTDIVKLLRARASEGGTP
jgi:hypothetical protein